MKILHRFCSAVLFVATLSTVSLGSNAVPEDAPYPASETEWRLIGGGSYEQHYSPLHQINDATIKQLKPAWFSDMPTEDGVTGVPLVAGGVIYQSGALGKVWANDARTGRLVWTYEAKIKFPLSLIASWGARSSRGLALWGNKVLKANGDCRLMALDRKTGTLLWEVKTCDPMYYKTISAAPRVGGGKVFIGNSNGDSGIGRGYVDAYNIETGRHLWRFYTIPGDPANGFESATMEMASKTWGKDYWKHSGGGSAWEGITYDPVTNLVYIGTDGPSPYAPDMRGSGGGDELFTNAIVAVNADTGAYVWHYSTTPGDAWNYAATMPVVLADLPIAGETRHTVMIAPKNGFFYLVDARTGKLINEPKPIVPENWASRIDMSTGRPVLREDAKYWLKGKEGAVVFPSPVGGHNWMPMSYSPQTGLVYIPTMEMPALMISGGDGGGALGQVQEDLYYGLTHNLPFKGSLLAWDPIKQQARWSHDVGLPYEGGVLSTAGNLVFQGTTEGYFNAYRADTGEKIWSFFAGSGILSAPSTVELDGKQLIVVALGSGTTSGVGSVPKFSGNPGGPARLMAFSLDGTATLPPVHHNIEAFPSPVAPEPEPLLAQRGKELWDANGCEICHGVEAIGGLSSVPDLRRITLARYDLFSQIVRGGLFKDAGMPVFAEALGEEDLPALKAYIIREAWKAYREDQPAHNGR